MVIPRTDLMLVTIISRSTASRRSPEDKLSDDEPLI